MNLSRFVLIACLLLISNNVDACKHRIVGGSDAEDGMFPYQVSLRMFEKYHFCGGSILNEYYILTAAHCIDGQKPDNISVVAGSSSLSKGGDSYKIESIIGHRGYSGIIIFNDIALLKLKTPIKFGPNVKAINLPTEDTKVGTNLTLSGWGMTKYPASTNSSNIPDKLQFAHLISISPLKCIREQLGIPSPITRNNICTFTHEGQGACKGDSGGPLVDEEKHYQVGVVSWGIPCAKGKPDVFTRVYTFLRWIKQNMKETHATSAENQTDETETEANISTAYTPVM